MVTEPGKRPAASYNRNSDPLPSGDNDDVFVPGDGNDDIEVHVEIVIVDGPEGARLQELQANAVDRTLRALLRARAGVPKGDQQ